MANDAAASKHLASRLQAGMPRHAGHLLADAGLLEIFVPVGRILEPHRRRRFQEKLGEVADARFVRLPINRVFLAGFDLERHLLSAADDWIV